MKVSRDRLILSLLIFCSVPVLGVGTIATSSLPVLAQTQTASDRKVEGDRLLEEARQLGGGGQNLAALEKLQQGLEIYRQIGDRQSESITLHNIGAVYDNLKQYPKALEFYQQALVIGREVGDKAGEGVTLNNIGAVYDKQGQYPRALEFYQQALRLRREVGGKAGEGATLNNIGAVYDKQGQYPRALEFYQQALVIEREVRDKAGEGATLNNIGAVYDKQGQYPRALEFYQQALRLRREVGDKAGEGATLHNIGAVYNNLGQYPRALEFLQQALVIEREVGDKAGEGATLSNIGAVYNNLGQYPKALEFHQQSLRLRREVGDKAGEGATLNNIGAMYDKQGQYPRALEFYQQSLGLRREVEDKAGEGATLNNIGAVYDNLGQYPRALEFYQQSLGLRREVGDKAGEGTTLNNIGYVLAAQKQPELAIVFYKASVNVRETIRQDLKKLTVAEQKTYTETVADSYRKLADLLLKQDRILEAQQVLDLLKVQELEDYLRNVRGTNQTAQGNALQPPEQNLIALGNELADLQNRDRQGKLTTPKDKDRLALLVGQEKDATKQFLAFLQSPEVLKIVEQLRRNEASENVNLEQYNQLKKLLAKSSNAVLLYPFILDDRLELILTTPNAPPIRRTVKVPREELNRTISDFRTALKTPSDDPRPLANKLYTWLIQPLEAELKQAGAQTIIYAPDGPLRYIPLATLYDGKQWLVEKYRVDNITSTSLFSLEPKPLESFRILLAAATQQQEIKVGGKSFTFGALSAAGKEVEAIATNLGTATKLIDTRFTKVAVEQSMNSHTIVHLATHGQLSVGTPEDSFIVFGNQEAATISEIQSWTLTNVALIVLSACETGIGEKLGDGKEILGLGYQLQRAGARAAIASLWKVDDGGTQILMTAFYTALKQKVSFVEALRQAQIALIYANQPAGNKPRGTIELTRTDVSSKTQGQLSHPYYWAPFILIGNGL